MKDKIDVDTQVWEIVTWKFTVDGMGRLKVLLTEKILGWQHAGTATYFFKRQTNK